MLINDWPTGTLRARQQRNAKQTEIALAPMIPSVTFPGDTRDDCMKKMVAPMVVITTIALVALGACNPLDSGTAYG
ncbi:MAG: hypothetical protein HY673_03005 [Chloroflexi bacterium]|nr:hypothetical protein [Chloroflexota bacterium]